MNRLARVVADIRARRAVMALAGKRRRIRRGRMRRQLQPDAIRMAYFRMLVQVLAQARARLELLFPRIRDAVNAAAARKEAERGDAWDDDFNDQIDNVAEEFFAEFTNSRLREIAADIGRRTSSFQRQQVVEQFRAALGIDIVQAEPWLEPKIQAFTSENVALIKSIPQRYFTGVERDVVQAMRQGLRWEELAKDLDRRYEVAEGHAKLVARDQVGKFMGELNKTRQENLGVKEFIWRTAEDNRVRESHHLLEGQTFSWDDLPEVDGEQAAPGQPIQCRCEGEPVLTEFFEALEAD
jgi:SPP1 gp7 family putative phage head morphogenesis protein